MNYKIYLSPPSQNGLEKQAINAALDSNWLAPVGPSLDQFENSLSAIHENKPVLCVNSGTAAIHLALQLCGVGKGDEVLVGTHTHNATVNPIIYQGASPIFVDSEEDTWNISPIFLEEAIKHRLKNGIKPKAILIVHLYGMAAKLDEILRISSAYDIPVIEDAAEALGSTYKGKALGSFGKYGILSFNGNKIISTSGGGALLLNNLQERERALFLATQARDDAPHFQHSEIGYNYRLSNILAALGNAQLADLPERVAKRRSVYHYYATSFENLNNQLKNVVASTTKEADNVKSNRWLSTFLVKPFNNITNSDWRNVLESNGIESRPLWKPMHLQPVFSNFLFFGNQSSDRIFMQGICLPSGFNLSIDQLQEITGHIHSLYK